jgi:hypothetical protein
VGTVNILELEASNDALEKVPEPVAVTGWSASFTSRTWTGLVLGFVTLTLGVPVIPTFPVPLCVAATVPETIVEPWTGRAAFVQDQSLLWVHRPLEGRTEASTGKASSRVPRVYGIGPSHPGRSDRRLASPTRTKLMVMRVPGDLSTSRPSTNKRREGWTTISPRCLASHLHGCTTDIDGRLWYADGWRAGRHPSPREGRRPPEMVRSKQFVK